MSEPNDAVKRELAAQDRMAHPEYYDNDGKLLPDVPRGRTYAPKSNVRTREQDEFMTVEKKARESKRQCRARVSLPSRDGKTLVSFECTDRAGHASAGALSGHSETGRVRLRNNHVYEYSIFWNEVEIEEIWRIEGSKEGDAQ